jgi:hypothetical protein
MKDVWDALRSIEGGKVALCQHAHTVSQRAQENWIKRDQITFPRHVTLRPYKRTINI